MNRPPLKASLSPEEFEAWYWLKEELVAFCRRHQLSTVGLKRELQARIVSHLSGHAPPRGSLSRTRTGSMPAHFSLDTVIGEGWRCGPALGAFFKQAVGTSFQFNAETRDFIHHQAGKTLADAAICYQQSVRPGRKKAAIPEQLEYNRHFREFFQQNPGASRKDAIAAWWAKRGARRVNESPAP